VHRFRLALVDQEALDRTQEFLADFGVETQEFAFSGATGCRQPLFAIRTSKQSHVQQFERLIAWPDRVTADWATGFLAGMFDAEGSYSRGILRISDRDSILVDQVMRCAQILGFETVLDVPSVIAVQAVRFRGGLAEHLRFFLTCDPAITRKRTFDGYALKSRAKLGVVAIEALGLDVPMYDITTGTGDFIANGIVSHNCFARNTHTYLDFDAGHDFDSQVVVKVNAPDLLRRELSGPRWGGDHIAMGTNVDVYQRAEGRYQLMRGILAALRDFANPFSILTKGTLLLRDLDLLIQAASVTTVGLSYSVGFVDEKIWREVEPGTPSPRRRLDAVRRLVDAGFDVGVLMAPVLPGLTDTDESIDETVQAIASSGAGSVTPISLHLRPGAKEWYAKWVAERHPDLLPLYRRLYGKKSYLADATQREIAARVRIAARKHGLGSSEPREARELGSSPERARPPAGFRGSPPKEGEFTQLTLI
jgi:DNA repair photolyase